MAGRMSLTGLLLIPLSWLFRGIVACRNKAFDWRILQTTNLDVPVISVGNVTVGGTGKTPLTEFVVQHCLGLVKRVAIVSRGYKRDSQGVVVVSDGKTLLASAREAGDEPVQIARKFPQAIVVVGERKVEAARHAVNVFHPDVVVLDDGFQHRYLRRDLDIVVVNSSHDGYPGRMLPAGRNREPWSAVRRAGLVALSHVVGADQGQSWKENFAQWFSGPWVEFRYKTAEVRRLSDQELFHLESLKGKPVFAFSGVGYHEGFVEGVQSLGCMITGNVEFPDHYTYDEADIKRIIGMMQETAAAYCITTEKDAIRLMADRHFVEHSRSHPFLYSRIEVEIVRGKELLTDSIDTCLRRKAS